MLTTALQLANTYATIGNGGTLYRPHFLKSIQTFDGKTIKEQKPEILSNADISPNTIALVRRGLWGVINTPQGTAYSLRIPGIEYAGKTGTA